MTGWAGSHGRQAHSADTADMTEEGKWDDRLGQREEVVVMHGASPEVLMAGWLRLRWGSDGLQCWTGPPSQTVCVQDWGRKTGKSGHHE